MTWNASGVNGAIARSNQPVRHEWSYLEVLDNRVAHTHGQRVDRRVAVLARADVNLVRASSRRRRASMPPPHGPAAHRWPATAGWRSRACHAGCAARRRRMGSTSFHVIARGDDACRVAVAWRDRDLRTPRAVDAGSERTHEASRQAAVMAVGPSALRQRQPRSGTGSGGVLVQVKNETMEGASTCGFSISGQRVRWGWTPPALARVSDEDTSVKIR